MLTTEEAARILGVSRRRVQELVRTGSLSARKVAGVWLLDEEGVAERSRSVNKSGGRPARGKGRQETAFVLMNRTHEVVRVVYHASHKRFSLIDDDVDMRYAPLGLAGESGTISLEAFNAWWRGRGIPDTREGLAVLLDESGVSLPQELLQRNLGLSLSDQYWIRPEGSGLAWEKINFFDNDFEQVSLATAPYAADGKRAAARPDNTSDGNLRKTWTCRNGVRVLLKEGSLYGQEPYNEVVATALHRRLLESKDYVTYTLEGVGATARCCCECFLTNQEEFVPALYVERCSPRRSDAGGHGHFLACCQSLGMAQADVQRFLDRMIVCDDMLANHDRHHRNFGIIRDVETGICRLAPLFDSGSSLWCDVSTERLRAGEHSFVSRQFHESPAKQMLLVSDLSWVDHRKLDGFVDEAMELLADNDALGGRLTYIRNALEWRVNRMLNIAEWD